MKVEILIGVAGVGKSTYVKSRITQNDLVLSSDEIRKELFGSLNNQDKQSHNLVFQTMQDRLLSAIQSNQYRTIYYDATNLNRKKRAHLYKLINKQAEVRAICFLKPLKDIISQNSKRFGLEKVPNDILLRMYKSFEVPRIGVDCDVIEKPYGKNFSDFKDEFIIDLPHDSSFHKESIKDHIKAAIISAPDYLKEVAKFHDLGKFICKQWKDESKKYANYKGHENVSAMYYLAYLDLDNVTQEQLDNLEIIKQHMNAHSGISDKLIKNNDLSGILDKINQFAEVDSKSKTDWDVEYFSSGQSENHFHFNYKTGKWSKCNAKIRKCQFEVIDKR